VLLSKGVAGGREMELRPNASKGVHTDPFIPRSGREGEQEKGRRRGAVQGVGTSMHEKHLKTEVKLRRLWGKGKGN